LSFVKRRVLRHYRVIRPFLPDGYRPFRVSSGRIYLNIKESWMMMARALGEYEPEKMEAVRALVRPGMRFVDVGANKGDFSLLAASLGAEVVCFEPEPSNCEWIRRSIALNRYSIRVLEAAASDQNGRAQLHLGSKSGWHSLLHGLPNRACRAVEVETRTLDSIFDNQFVDVIKIDVEGAEMRVLRGAEATLRRNSKIVLLLDLHPQFGVNVKEVVAFLRGLGFSFFRMEAPFNRPISEEETAGELLAYHR
jgi:FkbM family methyltransferase